MNEALLSSKNLNWCTPQDFFNQLNREFSFALDAAATDKSAKCHRYFTPENDGLKNSWGGVLFFATRPMAGKLGNGFKRRARKRRSTI